MNIPDPDSKGGTGERADLRKVLARGEFIRSRYLASSDVTGFAVNSDHWINEVNAVLRANAHPLAPTLLATFEIAGPASQARGADLHWRLLAVAALIDLLTAALAAPR